MAVCLCSPNAPCVKPARLFLTSQERHEAGRAALHGTLNGSDLAAVVHVLLGASDEPLLAGALQRMADEILAFQDAGQDSFESAFSALLFSWAHRLMGLAALARALPEPAATTETP